MEIKEQLEEMLTMQKALNESILKEFGESSMTEEKLQLAIIDEVGELTHELKGSWCWWKKTQKPVNRQRVLEELVDIYHFVMTYEMVYGVTDGTIVEVLDYYEIEIKRYGKNVQGDMMNYCVSDVASKDCKLSNLLYLTEKLGFTMDEVYQEYLNKNKINYERLKEGY